MTYKNILLAGAGGLIGTHLKNELEASGYTCYSLSHSKSDPAKHIYRWQPDLQTYDPIPDIAYHAFINLSGASIADTPWNKTGQQKIRLSRVHSTLLLKKISEQLSLPPALFISASAIGYYGLDDDAVKTESSPPGNDFAAKVCEAWEQSALSLQSEQTQVAILRIGIVLAKSGGFYSKIKKLSAYKIAAPISPGSQPISWIFIDDLLNIFKYLLENKISPDVYNASANWNSNLEITQGIAQLNGQNIKWPFIPGFLLKILFGMKSEIFTHGTRIGSEKLIRAGFKFRITHLPDALNLLA